MVFQDLKRVLAQTQKGMADTIVFDIDDKKYTRYFRPKERLILLGAGHIAVCLAQFASRVEFDVVVVDDRAEYARNDRFPDASQVICDDFGRAISSLNITSSDYIVVITRAHKYDEECLKNILESYEPFYVGLLGSKRRTTVLLDRLKSEGISQERLDEVNTPVGIDIGALTVEEIAVSITAQLIQYRRKGLNKNSSKVMAEETFHQDVVKQIVDCGTPLVLIMVYETIGSTPVKSGCFMAVNDRGECFGTIGGGLAENLAIRHASKIIGTKGSITVDLDLNDSEDDDAMVCGGTMKVLLLDM